MARTARPWWRSQKNVWCVTVNGHRIQLGPHPEGADRPKYNKRKDCWNVPEAIEDAWKAVQKGERPTVAANTTWAILDAFLEWTKNNRPASYKWYVARLQRFKDAIPNMKVNQLKTHQVQEWLDKQTWGANYKRGMVTAIKRVFNWAAQMEHIPAAILLGLKKPEAVHRELVLSQKEFTSLLKLAKSESFRDLLQFFWYCGCRPQEAIRIEAAWVDHEAKIITFPVLESKGKKRSRVIHLTDEAYIIVTDWAMRNPEGPIFRNSRRTPWTAFSIDCQFKRLKEKFGKKVTAYTLRHSYIHHGLTKGKVDPVVMATLAGHADTTMIMKVYGHLLKDSDFMREAAKRATGG